TINRIPIVYYGTEVSMDASPPRAKAGVEVSADASAPAETAAYDASGRPLTAGGWAETSRKDMEWDKDPDMLSYFKGLTSMRSSSKALREGRMLEMWQDEQVFAYSRLHPEQEAIVILNNSPDTQTRDIPLRAESQLTDGKVLKDLLSGETVVVKDRKIHVQSGGKRARVLVSA
ncbi:MAG: hypothetical protein HYU64_19470, partial [Armatimonadetes bacterium]|nr:hypothetical protein [Armatimonadota bacterium]